MKRSKKPSKPLIVFLVLAVLAGLTWTVVASTQGIQEATAQDSTAITQTRAAIAATCKPGTPKTDCWQLVGAGTPDDLTANSEGLITGNVQFGGECTWPVVAHVDNPTAVTISVTVNGDSGIRFMNKELADLDYAKLREARRDYGLAYCFLGQEN